MISNTSEMTLFVGTSVWLDHNDCHHVLEIRSLAHSWDVVVWRSCFQYFADWIVFLLLLQISVFWRLHSWSGPERQDLFFLILSFRKQEVNDDCICYPSPYNYSVKKMETSSGDARSRNLGQPLEKQVLEWHPPSHVLHHILILISFIIVVVELYILLSTFSYTS